MPGDFFWLYAAYLAMVVGALTVAPYLAWLMVWIGACYAASLYAGGDGLQWTNWNHRSCAYLIATGLALMWWNGDFSQLVSYLSR